MAPRVISSTLGNTVLNKLLLASITLELERKLMDPNYLKLEMAMTRRQLPPLAEAIMILTIEKFNQQAQ